MNFSDIFFYIFAIIIVIASGIAVFNVSPRKMLAGLAFAIPGITVMFFLLNSDYIAVLYLLTCIFGILPVLYLAYPNSEGSKELTPLSIGGTFAMIILGLFTAINTVTLLATRWKEQNPAIFNPPGFGDISTILVSKYTLTFEISLFMVMIMFGGTAQLLRKT